MKLIIEITHILDKCSKVCKSVHVSPFAAGDVCAKEANMHPEFLVLSQQKTLRLVGRLHTENAIELNFPLYDPNVKKFFGLCFSA
jgi:hypothetical protein